MNRVAADGRRENAMIRVFCMFVFMAVLSIRASVADPRCLEYRVRRASPYADAPLTDEDLYRNRVKFPLIAIAQIVADLLSDMLRLPYELLKQADAESLPRREPVTGADGLCRHDGTYLDTS